MTSENTRGTHGYQKILEAVLEAVLYINYGYQQHIQSQLAETVDGHSCPHSTKDYEMIHGNSECEDLWMEGRAVVQMLNFVQFRSQI